MKAHFIGSELELRLVNLRMTLTKQARFQLAPVGSLLKNAIETKRIIRCRGINQVE